MARKQISYRSGYKYQLAKKYTQQINIKPRKAIVTPFIELTKAGQLTVVRGYAWDGPSGPVIDDHHNMRASLVHDALYQLMRHKHLNLGTHRQKADKLFEKMCIEDGVPKGIARVFYIGLRVGGRPSADPANRKEILKAP